MASQEPGTKQKSTAKRVIKIILIVLLAIILIVGAYFAYVLLSYNRIEDNTKCDVDNPKDISTGVTTGTEQEISSWNIGFAAYLQDYGFFMDGGTESRARSKESVLDSMDNMMATLKSFDSDFYLIQEVDFDSTRSHKVDERKIVRDAFPEYAYTFAQNYDSPYLFYPITSPHGANKSGIVTLSDVKITSSLRRQLPIQTDLAKLLDLDRCYDIVRVPTDNGKELVLINFHLSAYTTDRTIADSQLSMIYDEMLNEYKKGNYVIAGGDFNKDLIGDSGKCFGILAEGDYSWCQPLDKSKIPSGISVIVPHKDGEDIASCRNADSAYDKSKAFRVTLDGFLVTDNVRVLDSNVIELEYMWSDHNPVYMNFILSK